MERKPDNLLIHYITHVQSTINMKRKHIISRLFAFMIIIASLSSCRDDLSSLDVNKIHGVEIDTTGKSTLSVLQFENLVVKPNLKTAGIPESDLSYEWKINILPSSVDYEVIGTEKDLDFEVRYKPTRSDKNHQILYTVTDNKTGLQYIMAWPLTIRNSIGEGLVIAETSDGVNSDLSHIMSPLVTYDYTGESVKHNIYSALNDGQILPGLVKQMEFGIIYGVESIMGITEKSVFKINTLDYTFAGMNDDLFFASTADYKPQMLGTINQGNMYVGNGKLTGTYLGASRKFGLPFDSQYVLPNHVAFMGVRTFPPVVINFYDEVNGHFVYQSSITTFGDKKMYRAQQVSGAAFNAGNLPNKVNLKAGTNSAGDFLHVLKDKSTNSVGLYILNGGSLENSVLSGPAPKAFFDLTNAPEINSAIHFVLLDNQSVMYYATKTKIYAVLFGTSTPVFQERYTVPAGEEITTLQIYRQSDYPLRDLDVNPPYLSTNNKQLVMSTYGTEGKVYLLPMTNPGVGNIDQGNIKTFGGFDRITAIAAQL